MVLVAAVLVANLMLLLCRTSSLLHAGDGRSNCNPRVITASAACYAALVLACVAPV